MEYIRVYVCVCLKIPYIIVFYQSTLLDACSFYIQIYTMWTPINYIKNPYIIICLSANITENCISSKSTSFFTESSRSLIEHWSMNHIYHFFFFLLFIPCMFWHSTHHSTYALYDLPFMIFINSYMFWHWGAILRKSFITKVYKSNGNLGCNQYIIQHTHSMICHLWYTSTPTSFGRNM